MSPIATTFALLVDLFQLLFCKMSSTVFFFSFCIYDMESILSHGSTQDLWLNRRRTHCAKSKHFRRINHQSRLYFFCFVVVVNVCSAEEQAQRYAVPSYEEAVCSGQYPISQSNLRPSSSQLPSYDDLVQVDGVQYEFEGSEVTTTGAPPPAPAPLAPAAAASASNRRAGKTSRKLLPIKIRRIKSEKLHMKNLDNSQPATGFSVEPLTPPPQYEDKVPPI